MNVQISSWDSQQLSSLHPALYMHFPSTTANPQIVGDQLAVPTCTYIFSVSTTANLQVVGDQLAVPTYVVYAFFCFHHC